MFISGMELSELGELLLQSPDDKVDVSGVFRSGLNVPLMRRNFQTSIGRPLKRYREHKGKIFTKEQAAALARNSWSADPNEHFGLPADIVLSVDDAERMWGKSNEATPGK